MYRIALQLLETYCSIPPPSYLHTVRIFPLSQELGCPQSHSAVAEIPVVRIYKHIQDVNPPISFDPCHNTPVNAELPTAKILRVELNSFPNPIINPPITKLQRNTESSPLSSLANCSLPTNPSAASSPSLPGYLASRLRRGRAPLLAPSA